MPTPARPTLFRMRDGRLLTIRFFGHASIAFEYEGRHIYVDPVMKYADYGRLPKADAILVTHPHYDHFDMEAVEALRKEGTAILCDRTTAESFEGDCYTMLPGAAAHPLEGVRVDAVAAYNTSPEQLQFHPRQSEFCGYLLTFADGESGMRVYVSGDTEPTDEMRALHDIDIAFVCVNQPYTMTPEQAVEAVEAIRPGSSTRTISAKWIIRPTSRRSPPALHRWPRCACGRWHSIVAFLPCRATGRGRMLRFHGKRVIFADY